MWLFRPDFCVVGKMFVNWLKPRTRESTHHFEKHIFSDIPPKNGKSQSASQAALFKTNSWNNAFSAFPRQIHQSHFFSGARFLPKVNPTTFFYVRPDPCGNDPSWRMFFSNGLVEPTTKSSQPNGAMKAYPPPGAAQDGKRTHGVAKWQVPRGVEVARFWFDENDHSFWDLWGMKLLQLQVHKHISYIYCMKILSNLEDGHLLKPQLLGKITIRTIHWPFFG